MMLLGFIWLRGEAKTPKKLKIWNLIFYNFQLIQLVFRSFLSVCGSLRDSWDDVYKIGMILIGAFTTISIFWFFMLIEFEGFQVVVGYIGEVSIDRLIT